MSNHRQQPAINLEQADLAAQRNFPAESVDSPIASCPIKEHEVFIVPARYALAEEAVEEPCLQPGHAAQSHPIALRRLRPGYLYIWQHEGPLKRYAISRRSQLQEQPLNAPDGVVDSASSVGIMLPKNKPVHMMYSEVPLPADKCEVLQNSAAERRRRMREIDLPRVAAAMEASHCPLLDKAEYLIAELNPAVRDRIKAHDYQANPQAYKESQQAMAQHMHEYPSPERVEAHIATTLWLDDHQRAAGKYPEKSTRRPGYWSSEPWHVQSTESWLGQARQQAGSMHAVMVAVEDILGMLRDLNHEQLRTSELEEEWDAVNGHKGLLAGFIRSLISEDGAELAGIINYRYREQDIQLTPGQGELLLQAQRDLEPTLAEETDINHNLRRTEGHAAADARMAEVRARQDVIYQPVREFIPPNLHGHIQGVILNYRASKARNMTDSRLGVQVAERVRLGDMEHWISEVAEPHQAWLADRRDALYSDTRNLLARHEDGTWFADYTDRNHCDWLSEVALNTLSELCTQGPGVTIATDLLRSPTPAKPLSLLASAFTPELSDFVDLSDRLTEVEGVLTADNKELAGVLIQRLAGTDKFSWLQGLGGSDGHDWGRAVSRLAAAFAELSGEHLNGAPAPVTIQHFPQPLLAMMVVLKVSGDLTLKSTHAGYRLSGSIGAAVWDWSNQAGQRLRLGLVKKLEPVNALNAYGGALSLVALLLHGINLVALRERDRYREPDTVRLAEHWNVVLNTAAALGAVIQSAAYARGATEMSFYKARLPLITLLGVVTGFIATTAAISDLVKLAAEQSKPDSNWSKEEWARLLRGTGQSALAATYAGVGGYATYMYLLGRWDAARATSWFIKGTNLAGWGVLLLEGLYLVWRYSTHTSDIQRFLEQCCWGNKRLWKDTEEDQIREFQALINLLFTPGITVETRTVIPRNPILSILAVGVGGISRLLPKEVNTLTLMLPGADPESIQLGIKLVAVSSAGILRDITAGWDATVASKWLPLEKGMGLKLTGDVTKLHDDEHLEVRVLYYSPLAMMGGAMSEGGLVVGGRMGMRYVIKDNNITIHANHDGALPSDGLAIEEAVAREKLQPEGNV